MTPKAQRIAIAEFCGYTHVRIVKSIEGPPDIGIGHHPTEPHSVPDYLNDLNAMHEAEKVLRNNQRGDFSFHLQKITGGEWFLCYNSTAAQRAEALLRTIGKWEATK